MKFSIPTSNYHRSTTLKCRIGSKMYSVVPSILMLVLFPPIVEAISNSDVDGMNGTVSISGALTESACRLEMSSGRQDVLMGEVSTGRLYSTGAEGTPVRVELRLEDCLHSSVATHDMRTGALSRASAQPIMSVSFSAVRDEDNPALVKVHGVSGVGLRLKDAYGRDVRLGSRGVPLLLQPGQNILSYTITPERTRADLIAGSYQARVNFHLSYD